MSEAAVPGISASEDLAVLVGRVIETRFTVGDESRRLFERATWLDREYGEALGQGGAFPAGMVEGFHLLSLLDAVTHPFFEFSPERWVSWNYGLDRVRFIRPVVDTDELLLRAEIAEVKAKDPGYLIRFDCAIYAERADELVLVAVADWLAFVTPRMDA